MDAAALATLITVLNALIKLAPEIPEVAAMVQTVINMVKENRAPTADEQAAIDAALEAAHAAFQARAG